MISHGIHHVTAICRDAQANVDFYVGLLGLRLVKRTVNFDDPETYHLYYGDAAGTPGTILTFFPYPGGRTANPGTGFVTETTLAAPAGSLDAWTKRLRAARVVVEESDGLRFRDPDGMFLRVVEAERNAVPYTQIVGPEMALRGVSEVALDVPAPAATEHVLTDLMQMIRAGNRFVMPDGTAVTVRNSGRPGHGGPGSVHHVAFRVQNNDEHQEAHREVEGTELHVSPILDRHYFRSIYYREPGGVLFEVATDPPGFAVDEDAAHLGESLRLPPQYERFREQLIERLPPLRVPGSEVSA